MKLFLFSNYDCLIYVQDEAIKLFRGQKKQIEADLPLKMQIFALHSQNQILPVFSLFEANKEKLICNCNCVKIYQLNTQNAVVEILPNYVSFSKTIASLSTSFADYDLVQTNYISLKCGGKEVATTNFVCLDAVLYENSNLVFCVLKGYNNKHLWVMDSQNNMLVDEDISQIENTQNSFQTFLNYHDMQKQGIVKKYTITNNEFKKESEYPVYISQSAKPLLSNKLIPQAFFEAVRVSNINLAKVYLSNELSSKITLAHLLAYFGSFDKIFNLTDCVNFPCFVLVDSLKNECKVFKLQLQNNAICNIEKM